jgi:ribosomal protein L29
MDRKSIANLSHAELRDQWVQLSKQLLQLRLKKQLGQLKVPSEYRMCRKNRARILMALSKKQS